MNFATLKGLTIPEGNVQSIVIDGKTMWTKTGNSPGTNPSADPWDAVFASIDAGTYATDYAIGDTVPIDLGSEGIIDMQIVAFDSDDKSDGSGKAPITWISTKYLASTYRWNPSLVTNDDGTNQEGTGTIGGWEKSEIRTYLQETIKPLMPENVQNRLSTVIKYSRGYDINGAAIRNSITEDDIWIPSRREFCGGVSFNGLAHELNGPEYSNAMADMKPSGATKVFLRTAKSTNNACALYAYGTIDVEVHIASKIKIGFCT